jgi:hypothetical protein
MLAVMSAASDNLARIAQPPPRAAKAPIRLRFSREFELACACCLWPPAEDRDRRVLEACEAVDWEAFMRVLERQRVQGLAYDALKSAEAPTPEPVQARLLAGAMAVSRRGAALAAETVRLDRRMREANIPVLFVKGAALAALAYGSQALKHGRDIDLIVPEANIDAAWRLLEDDGYLPLASLRDLTPAQRQTMLRLHKDIELTCRERRANVELHWRLTDNRALLAGLGANSPSQAARLPQGAVRTLADRELFAYLCVHGASHAWFRLKWLADLNAWLSTKTEAEVEGFYAFAAAEGVEACAGQALLLRQRLFGADPPASLAPWLGRDWKLRWLTAAALDAMAGARGEIELAQRPFGPFRILPAQFFRGRGFAFAAAQWGLMVENFDDALQFPLPRQLRLLYPLLRLPLWGLRLVRRRRAGRSPRP